MRTLNVGQNEHGGGGSAISLALALTQGMKVCAQLVSGTNPSFRAPRQAPVQGAD